MSETILDHIAYLRKFIPTGQISCIIDVIGGEEGQFFRDKLAEIHELIRYYMPRTYEADGQGDDAMVYLHYFKRGGDWYITERDKPSASATQWVTCSVPNLATSRSSNSSRTTSSWISIGIRSPSANSSQRNSTRDNLHNLAY